MCYNTQWRTHGPARALPPEEALRRLPGDAVLGWRARLVQLQLHLRRKHLTSTIIISWPLLRNTYSDIHHKTLETHVRGPGDSVDQKVSFSRPLLRKCLSYLSWPGQRLRPITAVSDQVAHSEKLRLGLQIVGDMTFIYKTNYMVKQRGVSSFKPYNWFYI